MQKEANYKLHRLITCSREINKYIQAPALVWNKTFKPKIQEFCDDGWASSVHEYTAVTNLKLVSWWGIV